MESPFSTSNRITQKEKLQKPFMLSKRKPIAADDIFPYLTILKHPSPQSVPDNILRQSAREDEKSPRLGDRKGKIPGHKAKAGGLAKGAREPQVDTVAGIQAAANRQQANEAHRCVSPVARMQACPLSLQQLMIRDGEGAAQGVGEAQGHLVSMFCGSALAPHRQQMVIMLRGRDRLQLVVVVLALRGDFCKARRYGFNWYRVM
ncbi:hypothetical protein CDAR_413811 [Caerostris darwini]|uniref:Uncharacterized protein n=1 Tax=Caerostris darwini TaxID=1538125 RepID=A0AAV4UE52_9ARAC|nr:hypothetical protein CDAR_413811 [Caerostris darwini]